jgi:hypothetical protein
MDRPRACESSLSQRDADSPLFTLAALCAGANRRRYTSELREQ